MLKSVGVRLAGGKKKSSITNADFIPILQAGWLGNEDTVDIGTVSASLVSDNKSVLDGSQDGVVAGNLLVGNDNRIAFFSPQLNFITQRE